MIDMMVILLSLRVSSDMWRAPADAGAADHVSTRLCPRSGAFGGVPARERIQTTGMAFPVSVCFPTGMRPVDSYAITGAPVPAAARDSCRAGGAGSRRKDEHRRVAEPFLSSPTDGNPDRISSY
jgi:hypothetical protein